MNMFYIQVVTAIAAAKVGGLILIWAPVETKHDSKLCKLVKSYAQHILKCTSKNSGVKLVKHWDEHESLSMQGLWGSWPWGMTAMLFVKERHMTFGDVERH